MEPKDCSRTESRADHGPLEGVAATSTAAAETNTRSAIPTVMNADNETLQPYRNEYGEPTGCIDEVNGLGATEVPFLPTRHELLLIVKHWALLSLNMAFGDFVQGHDHDVNCYRHWPQRFGQRRVIRAERLLGADVVRGALEGVEDGFRRSIPMTLREWDIFKHGTEYERVAMRCELLPRIEETQAQKEAQFDTWAREQEDVEQQMDMQEWREQHQAARDEEKAARADRDTGWQGGQSDR